jgi:hypothetical protein
MNDDERGKAAFMEAIKDVVLTLDTEHEGKPVVVKYRAAVALDSGRRIGTSPAATTPAITVVTYLVNLVVELSVDGQSVPVGRRGMTMPTAALFCWDILGEITHHVSDWAGEQRKDEENPHIRRAVGVMVRSHRRGPSSPKTKGKRR